MKVICDRSALLEAVNTVGSVVPTRSPSPALSCVKLTATKTGSVGALSLAGTDAEVAIALGLSKVDVVQAGVAVVSADRLRAIIGSIDEKDQTLTIELDGDNCHIKGTRSRFKLFAFPANDFPPLPDMAQVTGGPTPPRATFNVPAGTLLRLVNRTAFATARETSRYAINGVLFRRDGKKLEMVATDGRRLALCRASLKAAGEGTGVTSAIIPTKCLGLLTRVAHDPEGNVKVAITDNKAFFAFEDGEGKEKSPRAVVSTTLVEGAFPPYEDVIPKDQDKKITAAREDLMRAVRQAEILTNEESRGVRMSFNNKDKSAKLFSRSPEMGESEIELALSGYEGENIEISFNPRFIADALKMVDEPEVLIELKAPNKPGLFKAGADFVYVVMPVNLPS
ncbi:MAG: DNA polymerase III subunit beta [Phycisphaerales bacterium]|nr:DNA polymerase III subunit beta [Phycisphaerales bacterium]